MIVLVFFVCGIFIVYVVVWFDYFMFSFLGGSIFFFVGFFVFMVVWFFLWFIIWIVVSDYVWWFNKFQRDGD